MSLKTIFSVAAFALAATTTSAAYAHAKLVSSEPQAGSALATAPTQVRLKFNEALEPAFSKIKLTTANNAEVAAPSAQVDKADATVMSMPLQALASGSYRVQWTTMTHDGHKAKGEFTFQVK